MMGEGHLIKKDVNLANEKKKIVYIAALLYVLVTGHSFLFTKVALEGGGPVDILAHRFVAAFLGLAIAMALGWVRVSFKKSEVLHILPLALFYPLSFFGFQTVGLMYATSAEAGIMMCTTPFQQTGGGRMRKESPISQ